MVDDLSSPYIAWTFGKDPFSSPWDRFAPRSTIKKINKKHLKNVGPIRHCEPPHAACSNFTLSFTRCRYCRTPPAHRCPQQQRQQRQRVTVWQRGPLWPHRMGPKISTTLAIRIAHWGWSPDELTAEIELELAKWTVWKSDQTACGCSSFAVHSVHINLLLRLIF